MKPPTLDRVIDISHYQGNPDFKQVKASGIDAVIHKCTQGVGWSDDQYKKNQDAAAKAGLMWAAYHFGTNLHSGAEQANYFLKQCGKVRMALDYEPDGSSTMTIEQAEEFCRAVEIVTKKPTIIYTGSEMFPDAMALRFSCYGERPLWFPQFASSPNKAPTRWRLTMWQYTASGSVAGVAGDCDRDKFYGTPQALTALFVP